MASYNRDGMLIDVSVLSDGKVGSDGWVVEFWDLTPGGIGEFMHIHVDAHGNCTTERMVESVSESLTQWALSIAKSELA
ncbi:hypothetical protein QQY24_00290 [Streptomyces sp. TG1A-8]|uniref:hypothetical protein n=1 Tax=Streptomyces sp. TG1A-8 TaxID=3051385 RepID=UPI00265C3FA0|nr:hypothetical protein [Streptomyces sp. TG1A-8]MDO0923967.1 hypothetical protein [Streptomyces sp. TG1A-8]